MNDDKEEITIVDKVIALTFALLLLILSMYAAYGHSNKEKDKCDRECMAQKEYCTKILHHGL